MPIEPHLTKIPPHLLTLLDYEREAKKHLPTSYWAYLQSGAMNEINLKRNLQQFADVNILPRVLNDLTHGNTHLEIFGQDYPHPIFLAPIGHQALFHPEAEQATALAAEVMQSNIILSTFTNISL